MEKDKEIRTIDSVLEIRKTADNEQESRLVEGRAIVFDSRADFNGWSEIITREAVTQDLLDNSDVFARVDHRDDFIVARRRKGKGSLSLELRDDGLYYSFEAPKTAKGDELLEAIRRGDLTQSSFCFRVGKEEGDETWTELNDYTYLRTINKIDGLHDVAPVYNPAYSTTSCSLRCEEKVKEFNEIKGKLNAMIDDLKQL